MLHSQNSGLASGYDKQPAERIQRVAVRPARISGAQTDTIIAQEELAIRQKESEARRNELAAIVSSLQHLLIITAIHCTGKIWIDVCHTSVL